MMKPTRALVAGYRHELILFTLLLILLGTASVVSPAFLDIDTQRVLLSHAWEMALLTIPMMLIILTGGIDLSVGSTMALAAVAFGLLVQRHYPLPIAIIAAVVTGVACGALNGWCTTRFRIHPLIVTLATLSAYRGIAEGVSGGASLSDFPLAFAQLAAGEVAGIPYAALLYIALVALVAVTLVALPVGRGIVATGFNETAARFSALRVDRIKIALYTFSGTIAAISAIIFASRRNTANAGIGTGMELDVITAVVLGGTSIFGGRGTVVGTVLGFLVLHESREWMSWAFDRDEVNLIFVGVLLIVSVLLQRFLSPNLRRDPR